MLLNCKKRRVLEQAGCKEMKKRLGAVCKFIILSFLEILPSVEIRPSRAFLFIFEECSVHVSVSIPLYTNTYILPVKDQMFQKYVHIELENL